MIYEYHDRNKATKEELIEDIVSIETDNFIFESGGEGAFCNRCNKFTIQEWHETVMQNLNIPKFSWEYEYKDYTIDLLKELHKVLTTEHLIK